MKKHLFYFLITLLSIQVSHAQCDNVTSSGSIAADQVVCADNPDPATILNVELPAGGSGDLEFLWISTTQDPSSSTSVWFPIPGSTEDSYNPEPISQTTYYRRCSRRADCSDYIGESNIVTVVYLDECVEPCDFFKLTFISSTPADCGLDNGTVNLSIVAGTLPLSYNLNGEILSELPDTYAAGSYDLTATDAEGCTDDVSFVIEGEENTLAVVGDVTNPICQSANGSIVLSISGGSGEYTASWNDGSTELDRSDLLGGTYTVTITDENGCSTAKSFVLTTLDGDLVVDIDVTNASCNNSDGSAELIIEGGVAPYIIKLDGNTVTEITNLSPDSYIVSVTDANGCSTEINLVIEGSESTIAILGTEINPICTADNGSIHLEVSGNTGLFSIDWDFTDSEDAFQENLAAGDYGVIVTDENGCSVSESFTLTAVDNDLSIDAMTVDANCGGTGSASIEISNGTEPYTILINGDASIDADALIAGDYTINATDANGCTAESTFTITEIESDISIAGSSSNPTCNNDNGIINLNVSGGTGAISILWNDGNTDLLREELAAGTYTVIATDENNCTATETFELISGDSDLAVNLNLTDVSCNGGSDGSAVVEITGGTAPYILTLDGVEVTEIINLSAGEYTVKVVDAAGCLVTIPLTIAQNPLLMIDANIQNPSCGAENGSIELILSGGAGNYTVVWDDNLFNDLIRNDLAPGVYSLSVKDENDCIVTTQFTLTGEDSNLETELAITNVSCNGTADGSVVVTINNGTPPYFFTLNGAVVTDLNNLPAGDYFLETTDITGCSITDAFTISEAAPIEIIGTINNPTCGAENGSIILNITGGTADEDGNYSITWSNGDGTNLSSGNYSVTVTDVNGCNNTAAFLLSGSETDLAAIILTTPVSCHNSEDGTANITISGGTAPYSFILNGEFTEELPLVYSAGDYTVVIMDANACSIERNFNISGQIPVELSATVTHASCSGLGNIDLMVNGGIAPYTYSWSNGTSTQNQSNIPTGDYFVTVSDANGCTSSNTEAYTVNEGGSTISISVETTDVSCFGGMNGTAIVSIEGATEPFSYILNGVDVDDLPMNFAAGEYTLSIQDANGCANETTFSISQAEAAISFSGMVQAASCGSELGNISLSIMGGTAPYSFLWSNDEETQNLNDISIGSYTVTITDANDCTVNNDDNPFTFVGSSDLSLSSGMTPTTCGEDNGMIAITISQGTPPYQIVWNDGLTDIVLRSDLSGGDYSVVVTDANGCSVSEDFAVASSIEFTVNITPISASCNGMDDGEINMSFAGGTAPFVYILNGQFYDNLPTTLLSDDYQLQVLDVNGCSDLVEFSIGEPEEIIYLAELTDANCPGEFVTVEFATVQGGSGEYTYLWSDGATTLDRDDLTNGSYLLTITDTNGCTAVSEPFIANVPATIDITADEGDFQNISCFGEEDGAVDITVVGGTSPYSYFWSNGETTEDIENLAPDDYLLQLADANGCSTVFLAVISNPLSELSATSIVQDASCMQEDGNASIWPAGGTQPYFFLWDTGSTNAEEFDLAPGLYKVTVSDFGGCEFVLDFEVGEMECLQSEEGEDFSFVMNEVVPNLTTNSIEVHWMTEAEALESFFIIQHSQDGETFTDVSGLLPGEGATQSQNEYYNTCVNMALGTHFFRIRYVDAFGNLRTSETMSTSLIPTNKTDFSVFPNPTMDEVNISFLIPLDAPAQVQIVNAQAGILENITAPIGTLHQNIDLRKYNPGVYFVIVQKEGLRRLTKRVVKM